MIHEFLFDTKQGIRFGRFYASLHRTYNRNAY